MYTGNSFGQAFLIGQFNDLSLFGSNLFRSTLFMRYILCCSEQALRCLPENSDRISSGIFDNLSSWGIRSFFSNLSQAHGYSIGKGSVATGVAQ